MAADTSAPNILGLIASLSSSYLTFASAIITAAVWPVFALLIIWMFRSHVVGLLPFVERFEIWGAKVELKRQLSQAEQGVATTPDTPLAEAPTAPVDAAVDGATIPPDDAEPEMTLDDAVKLLRRDPTSVPTPLLEAIALHGSISDPAIASFTIMSEWSRLARAAYEAAEAADMRFRGDVRRVSFELANRRFAGRSLVKLTGDLQEIRNRVAHSPSSADLSDATRFSSLAERAIAEFQRATRLARARSENKDQTPSSSGEDEDQAK